MAMTTRCMILVTAMGLLLPGCSKKPDSKGETVPPTQEEKPAPAGESTRPTLTAADCESKGGRVVGDIGDGAIHRPDYTCEGGQPPLGNIGSAEGEPVAIEGSVCCPAPAAP